jgi:hydroxypyruvate isomerase
MNSLNRRDFVVSASTTLGAVGAAGLAASAAAAGGAAQPTPVRSIGNAPSAKFRLAYAPHFGTFSNHAKDDLDQIRFAADNGFTAWEDNGMRGRSKDFQDKCGKLLASLNMTMGVFVGADIDWGNPSLTTGKQEHFDKFVANLRDSVEVAKRLNAKWCTIVPGTEARNIPHGIQTANVIEAFRRGCEVCEKSGLIMVLEPLNWRDHSGLFVRYSDHAYTIMKGVKHPSAKILFDIYHQQASEGNLIQNIDRCWDEIAYFQIGDNPGRNEPGTGEINYKNVFKHIHNKGFKGVLGMEHGNSQGGKDGEQRVIAAYREADSF